MNRIKYLSIVVLFVVIELFYVTATIQAQVKNAILPEVLSRNDFLFNSFATLDAVSDYLDREARGLGEKGNLYQMPGSITLTSISCGHCRNATETKAFLNNKYLFDRYVNGFADFFEHYLIDERGIVYIARGGGNGVTNNHSFSASNQCLDKINTSIRIGLVYDSMVTDVQQESLIQLTRLLIYANGISGTESLKKIVFEKQGGGGQCELKNVEFPGMSADEMFEKIFHKQFFEGKDGVFIEQDFGGAPSRIFDLRDGFRVVSKSIGQFGVPLSSAVSNQFFDKSDFSLGVKQENSLLKVGNYPFVYLIEGGKRWFVPQSMVSYFENKGKKSALVSPLTIDRLPYGGVATVPDNLIIKAGKERYMAQKNELFPAITSSTMNTNFEAITIDPKELQYFHLLPNYWLSDGSLVREKNSEKIFLVEGSVRRYIPSIDIFNQYGFKMKDVIEVSEVELGNIPLGTYLTHKNYSLVRVANSAELFLIRDNWKFLIANRSILKNSELSSTPKRVITEADFELYSNGFPLTSMRDFSSIDQFIALRKQEEFTEINKNIRVLLGRYSIQNNVSDGAVLIESTGGFYIRDKEGKEMVSVEPQTKYLLNLTDIIDAPNDLLTLDLKERDDTFHILFINRPTGEIQKQYIVPGAIRIHKQLNGATADLSFVNVVDLEQYVQGVWFSNIANSELLDVLTISARSYALGRAYANYYHNQTAQYDLQATENTLVYQGKSTARIFSEGDMDRTRGQIMMYKGVPIIALLSRTTEGKSYDMRKTASVLYDDKPYLWGGVEDSASYYRSGGNSDISSAGLSIEGATTLLRDGMAVKDILEYYYPGARLVSL